MATTASSSSGRTTYSCIRCADRKVRCNRERPCSACVKHNVDCVFNLSQPPRKKHRRVQNQILIDQIKHYEALLQERGIDPSKLPGTPDSEPRRGSSHAAAVVPQEFQSQTPSSVESEPSRCVNNTQVIHDQGRFKFVENSLWTRVVAEFHNPEDALEESSNDASDQEASDDDFGFVLRSRPKSNARARHPPPERINQLWQIFIENVDPLTKVVHVPTLRPAIQKAATNIGTIPRSFEALMFAIYGAAVMSLKDDECKERLGESRKTLLSHYISATKAALSRAKLMGTISLVVLQALVLHLLAVRDIYEPRVVWSLTGVAIRIAQVMGIERDGVSLGLPPFETEIRRRIWWLLKTHDFRTAELCGLAKFRDLDTGVQSTKWPTNVNDDQLYPGMPSLVAESNTFTDMVFIALRCEMANFAANRIATFRQQGKHPSQWELDASGSDKVEIDDSFRELEEIVEMKYIRYCDPSQPLHLMIMLAARCSMNVIRFLTHHPRKWASIEQIPPSERQWLWEVGIKLLEQHSMLQSNPQLKRFAWHAAYFQQWHAFIHVLDALRANPLIADAEKAWQIVGSIYENTPDMVFDMRKPIHVAVGNLCLKAYGAREAALQNGNTYSPPTPEFILQLRHQREVAKAKRQARDIKSSRSKDLVSHGQENARDLGPRPEAGVIHLSNTLESTSLQQNTTSQPPSPIQPGGATEDDPFWFINGFDDSQVGNLDNVMNIDLDFMLAQDYGMANDDTQPITWEQWDAWLANSNVMRPLSSEQDLRMGT
ncbi:hypothetical protein MMC11_004656 [Xylographa trunciseda]|nr:hypothetical protein [Xylographa trunciseda]